MTLTRLSCCTAVLALAVPCAASAEPIPSAPTTAPAFVGAAATPRAVPAPVPPQHPFLAANERSNLHNDGWQTDSYRRSGPLGRDPRVLSELMDGLCGSITFTRDGRLVTVCVGLNAVTLRLLEPATLATLAEVALPRRQVRPGQNVFQNFTGGGYFYLDERDRAVVATADRRLKVYAVRGNAFALERDVALGGVVGATDGIVSALPDQQGNVWFVSRAGVVGIVDRDRDAVRATDFREPIGNSFAVDADGVSIVTDAALYEMVRGADGRPRVVWRQPYDNDGRQKPGQSQAGSGTTPTLMPGGLVAITGNADPVHVVVFRRARDLGGARREVCRQAVFERGASSTDQSLISDGRNLVVENNFGYEGPGSVSGGRSTTPGLARVDVDAARGRCSLRWTSAETAPSAVPKLALGSGLVYTWTKDPDPVTAQDPWYLTAIAHDTGRTAFKVRAGAGPAFNNNYAPITIGPDGTAYIGVLTGLVAIRDAVEPQVAPAPVLGAVRAPRIVVTCGRRGTAVLRVRGTAVRSVRVEARGRARVLRGRSRVSLRFRPGRRVRVTVRYGDAQRRTVRRDTAACRARPRA